MFVPEDVERVARLARLELSPDETALFARQLGQVLAYAGALRAIDTTGVPPDARAAPDSVLRDDVVRPSLPRDALLAAAPDPDLAAGLFKVPRVIG
jgi:aspartyl-tRNA(Asn)/glutamyl-tRNA(Gln) amidotransferase subunit C